MKRNQLLGSHLTKKRPGDNFLRYQEEVAKLHRTGQISDKELDTMSDKEFFWKYNKSGKNMSGPLAHLKKVNHELETEWK